MFPNDWTTDRLRRYIDIKHGFAFDSDCFNTAGNGTLLLTPAHFREDGGFRSLGSAQKYFDGNYPPEYLLGPGALLVAMTEQAPGLLGSSLVIPNGDSFLHNQRLGLVRVLEPDELDATFLYHLFNAHYVRKQISVTAAGTKVRHSSPDRIKAIQVGLPCIEEQRWIANLLTSKDRLLSSMAETIRVKRHFRKGLMQQLLTGKRRFPEFVQSTDTQHSRYFDLPADWKLVRVGKVACEVSDRNGTTDGLPVLSCTKHDGLVESLKYFGRQVFSDDRSNYKVVRRGQFAYATNHIEEGSIGLLDSVDAGVISPMYTVFATKEDVHAPYLYLLFKTELYRHIFEANTNASVDRRGSLRWNEFKRLHIPLPSKPEQEKIAECIANCQREIDLLEEQRDTTQEQKKGLMQQLLTGKVRVPVSQEPVEVT